MKHLVLLAALLLAGCNVPPSQPGENDTGIWTDPSTGCRYLLYEDGIGNTRVGSLSIRYNADGTPDCPGVRK